MASSNSNLPSAVLTVVAALQAERKVAASFPVNMTPRDQMRRLLTVRPPAPLPSHVHTLIDTILQQELAQKRVTRAADLPRAGSSGALPRISLWRGDITSLACSGIVNAANSALLGCFQPTHRCIDNVIHDAAGPRLRAACGEAMHAQGHQEDVGQCKMTPAFNLPSQYVLHTVGPQLDDSQTEPSEEQAQQLKNCYLSCLNAAHAAGDLTSLAFCCISTGLFGYPQEAAARVAIRTTSEWLEQHAADSKLQHVIFDVFLAEDERIYLREIELISRGAADSQNTSGQAQSDATSTLPPAIRASLVEARDIVQAHSIPAGTPLSVPHGVSETSLQMATSWLRSAGDLLICGAAGLSAATGLDYTSPSVCRRLFPAMAQHDFHVLYQAIGKSDWSPEVKWGYLFHQLFVARYNWPRSQIYQELLTLSKRVDGADSSSRSFVYTSNVDGMFGQNGFDLGRIYTTQGDYGLLQCLEPCAPDSFWPTDSFIEAALPHINPRTQELDPAYIPRCPRCSGQMMMNVRGGDWFLEDIPHAESRQAYHAWLHGAVERATAEKPLVILEIGAGFNTPGVIRIPMQRLATRHPHVRLIRVNAQYPEVPREIDGLRAVGLQGDAAEVVHFMHEKIIRQGQTVPPAAAQ